MLEDVGLYGGFAGNEGIRAQRDWKGNQTTLSGDITGDNSYHVVTGADGAVLDGFFITGGYADSSGGWGTGCGGGMFNYSCSPTVANCVFTGNYAYRGAGIYNYSCSLEVSSCVFTDNTGSFPQGGHGGAICNDGALCNPVITNSLFVGNHSRAGGAIASSAEGTHPTLTNCTFTLNDVSGGAAPRGGAMYNEYASPTITNCIFWDDIAPVGSEVYNLYAAANPSFRSSDIEGCGRSGNLGGTWNTSLGHDGQNNIDDDPEFQGVSPWQGADGVWMTEDDSARPGEDSPCIDAADGDAAPADDISGWPRQDDETTWNTGVGDPPYVDMGAYECGEAPWPVWEHNIVFMVWCDEAYPVYYRLQDPKGGFDTFWGDIGPCAGTIFSNYLRVRGACFVPLCPGSSAEEEPDAPCSIQAVLPIAGEWSPSLQQLLEALWGFTGTEVAVCPRFPDEDEKVGEFNSLRGNMPVDYLVVAADYSCSMGANIWPSPAVYESFKARIRQMSPRTVIVEVSPGWPNGFYYERWLHIEGWLLEYTVNEYIE